MNLKEAIATIERHDVSVSLLYPMEFVRKVALIIKGFEERLGQVVSLGTLKDGDIIVVRTKEPLEYEFLDKLGRMIKATTGPLKVGLVNMRLEDSIEALSENDRQKLLKLLTEPRKE